MANVKFFIDQAVMRDKDAVLDGVMAQMRALICDRLEVAPGACQFAALAVRSLPDQPPVNVELHILAKPDRTPEKLRALCLLLRDQVSDALSVKVAIRCAQLDAASYIAIK
jgi:hypothetical protein